MIWGFVYMPEPVKCSTVCLMIYNDSFFSWKIIPNVLFTPGISGGEVQSQDREHIEHIRF